jgi:Bax protein
MPSHSGTVFVLTMAGMALLLVVTFLGVAQVSQSRVRTVEIEKALDLEFFYSEIGYTLAAVRNEGASVPAVDLTAFPDNWLTLDASPRRSRLFLKSILPLALIANEAIAQERARLETVQDVLNNGKPLSRRDETWLADTLQRYGLDSTVLDKGSDAAAAALLPRIDAVPVSLVLAQAAIESGWGSSRFAYEGNALFGQWTYNGEGMVPDGGQRQGFNRVASFPDLLSSVEAYMRNLNSHEAYAAFRDLRAQQRKAGEALDGYALATKLTAYSEKGEAYVTSLQQLITQHNLTDLREAKLVANGPVYTLNP